MSDRRLEMQEKFLVGNSLGVLSIESRGIGRDHLGRNVESEGKT